MAVDPRIAPIAKAVLAGKDSVEWKVLLTHLLDLKTLRGLTRDLGLSPKGFRIDRAPAKVLAPLLAEVKEAAQVDRIVTALVGRIGAGGGSDSTPQDGAETSAQEGLLRLKEQENGRLQDRLAKAEEGNAGLRARLGELDRDLAAEREASIRARNERDRLAQQLESLAEEIQGAPEDRDVAKQLVDLEREQAGLWESCEHYRRMLAERETRIRDLQGEVDRLEALIPEARRRKNKPMDPVVEPEKRFIVPVFQPGFYRSLDGKDRRSVERAVQAVFLFCTEGHSYPGLEAKQLGGTSLWSVRAGIKLRVYLEMRTDGDVEVVGLADREDQDTMLKRLKARGDGA